MEILFAVCNLAILPFWFLIIVLPRWRWTRRLMEPPLILIPLPLIYSILLVPRLPELLPILFFPDLATIASSLSSPWGALLGWVHFLALDLFVGRWTYLDSRQRDLSTWLMAPIMVLILLVGPLGSLLYLSLRGLIPGKARSATDLAEVRIP